MTELELCTSLNISQNELKGILKGDKSNWRYKSIRFISSYSQFDFQKRLTDFESHLIQTDLEIIDTPVTDVPQEVPLPTCSMITQDNEAFFTIEQCMEFITLHGGNRSIGAATIAYEELLAKKYENKEIKFMWSEGMSNSDKSSCMRGAFKRILKGKRRGAASNNHSAKYILYY